jgi:DNA/RNA non-specific endonuclease
MACGNTATPDDVQRAEASAQPVSHPSAARQATVSQAAAEPGAYVRDGRVDYHAVREAVAAGKSVDVLAQRISSAWAAQYQQQCKGPAELVEVNLGSLTYLFDIAQGRTVGVYGKSVPTSEARPESRMRGHPSYNHGEKQIDRGHLAAHTIGGGADINLVAQDHALNISGAWRGFERYAQENPGTFFAVQVEYATDQDRPSGFVYGMVRDGQFEHQQFTNG